MEKKTLDFLEYKRKYMQVLEGRGSAAEIKEFMYDQMEDVAQMDIEVVQMRQQLDQMEAEHKRISEVKLGIENVIRQKIEVAIDVMHKHNMKTGAEKAEDPNVR